MTQLAKRQPHLLAQGGDMADAASRIASNVINGPKNGFSLICGLRIRRWWWSIRVSLRWAHITTNNLAKSWRESPFEVSRVHKNVDQFGDNILSRFNMGLFVNTQAAASPPQE